MHVSRKIGCSRLSFGKMVQFAAAGYSGAKEKGVNNQAATPFGNGKGPHPQGSGFATCPRGPPSGRIGRVVKRR